MKKFFVPLCGLVMILSSCEVFDTFFNQSESDCQLLSTEWSIPNDPAKLTTEYIYDADDKLIELIRTDYDLDDSNSIIRFEITYTGDKINEIIYYSKFLTQVEQKQLRYVFYFLGDEVDSVAVTGFNDYEYTNDYILTKYENGKLVELKTYQIDAINGDDVLTRTKVLTWTGDNVSSIGRQFINGSMSTVNYEYDDKNSPLVSVGLAIANHKLFTILSKNNLIRASQPGGVLGGTGEIVYEISYNDNDYPESIQEILNYDTYPTTYTYDCK